VPRPEECGFQDSLPHCATSKVSRRRGEPHFSCHCAEQHFGYMHVSPLPALCEDSATHACREGLHAEKHLPSLHPSLASLQFLLRGVSLRQLLLPGTAGPQVPQVCRSFAQVLSKQKEEPEGGSPGGACQPSGACQSVVEPSEATVSPVPGSRPKRPKREPRAQ